VARVSTLTDDQRALLAEITRGGLAAFENAERLYFEASILRTAEAYSRALFLHQISMEELAKLEALGGAASGVLMGLKIELASVTKNFTHHKAKNHLNAYMLPRSGEEKAATKRRDVKAAVTAFKNVQTAFHKESNDAKNAALYVDFDGKTFITPTERVTAEMAASMAKQNEEFLGLMAPKRDMLMKWNEDPDAVLPVMTKLTEMMTRLRREYKDEPFKAGDILMDELLKSVKGTPVR
jgi:AbiV family abortive infection protein